MLNAMNTSVNMFVKTTSFDISAAAARREEEAERSKMDEQYQEFDKVAWWWYAKIPIEAKLLRIEVDSAHLQDQLNRYNNGLVAATEVLNGVWDRCVRQACKPGDPSIKRMLKEADEKLRKLQTERDTVTGQLVYMFAPREAKVQQLLTQSQ
jgi:hypothetical protein